MNTDIAIIQSTDLVAAFKSPEQIDKILERIAASARAFAADVNTAGGRADIASVAYKIARSKTALDDAGKALGDDHRKAVNVIDAERRKSRDFLDALKDEVRAPLTKWEVSEESRKAALQERLGQLGGAVAHDASAATIMAHIERITAIEIDASWQELEVEAATKKTTALAALATIHASAVDRERQAEELERLRAEAAKREADDAARHAVEAETERKRVAAEHLQQAERRAAEAAKVKAEQDAKAAIDAAKARENEANERAARAATEERERLEGIAAKERRAAEERRADESRRGEVFQRILAAVTAISDPKILTNALIDGGIPHCKVEF